MGITALVMAGGKGTRMKLQEEKPLLKVGGKPMIEHVLEVLKDAEKIDEIVVAVSRHTPKTAKLMERFSVKVLETPGKDYVSDVGYAVRRLKLDTILTISADLPLVTGDIIDKVIEKYVQCGKPALTVAVPVEKRKGLDLEGGYILEVGNRGLVSAGINVIDGRRIDEVELEEEIYVIDKEEVAVNVNTLHDLKIAEHLFAERLRRKSQSIMGNLEGGCSKLRLLLEMAVKKNLAEAILLSGGLDTSILAVIASRFVSLKAVTVAFQNAPAPDVEYAVLMANKLGLKHIVHIFNEDELYDAIPVVVKTMRSFDPMEIRNSVTIYVGLKAAKENGICTVMTGDGCDELFAGYSFLFGLEKEKLELELRKLWSVMSFSSVPLVRALGMEARLPYLDPEFKSFAMKLDSRYKIRIEKGQVYGKWILRKAFEKFLPREVAWRVKMPIEHGSGTTTLPSFFNSKISDMGFDEKRRKYLDEDKVIVRDKEQLFYYEIYRSVIGVPYPSDVKGKICPQCNSNVPEKATYCRTCGAYPI